MYSINNCSTAVQKIGYLVSELYDMRKGWIMALTPSWGRPRFETLGP